MRKITIFLLSIINLCASDVSDYSESEEQVQLSRIPPAEAQMNESSLVEQAPIYSILELSKKLRALLTGVDSNEKANVFRAFGQIPLERRGCKRSWKMEPPRSSELEPFWLKKYLLF